jgi:hypothetical protein
LLKKNLTKEETNMIHKLLRLVCSIVALGLLLAPHAWTAPAGEYYIPRPLVPQLSSDGNTLDNGAQPLIVVDRPKPPSERRRIPARFDLLSLPESATATFSITYIAAGGTDLWGESCTAFPESAKAAFNAAAAIWGNILQSSVPITINACWASLSSTSTLGYSGGGLSYRNFTGAPRANTWYRASLANALAGSDRDATKFDMHITYNSNFSWYYGTDGMPPSTQHDLMSVVLHEIGHGLNFSGSMTYSGGTGSWGYSTAYPDIYDTFIKDGSGKSLTDTMDYGNPSTALGTALTGGDIWFHGSNAMAANGGQRVKMYAPATWSGGSSYSHMDYATFNNTANQLMVYAISAGEAIHDPGPVATGLLKDLGWPIGAGPVNGVCGSSNGQTLATAPTTNLCSAGTATAVSGSGPWTWSCTGSNGGSTASCSANKSGTSPVNGVCGSSNGQTFATAPTTNLCSAGTATAVSGSGPWTWNCTGSNGGSTASCSANKTGAHTTFTTGPYGNNANITDTLSIPGATSLIVTVTGNTELNYDFLYIYNSSNVLLRTFSGPGINQTFTVTGSSINILFTSDFSVTDTGVTVTIASASSGTNGVCGSSNGQTFATAPTTNLCSAGTATAVSGSGPWTWSCTGLNGGTTASCWANKTGSAGAALYFPHVDTSWPWATEIAIINTGDQTVTGTLRGLSNPGLLVETKAVTLPAHGRRQITVADEFMNHLSIGYIIFDTTSSAVQGYTKFYQAGTYRAAIPAVKEVNTSDIYIPHIASNSQWWTGVSLVNTTSSTKELTITFNTGQSRSRTLLPNEHQAFDIASLVSNQPWTDLQSAVITNASGIIGLELFGNIGGNDHLDGILLTDKTASTIYYPHVENNGWWTGIVAYNPSLFERNFTITPYSAQGVLLTPSTLSIAGKGKYVGIVAGLGLPAQTAWFRIDSTGPLSGFELFSTLDDNQLAAYAGGGGTGARTGVFAKIEKNGWTGIAFVNTEASAATVTLISYRDNGTVVDTQVLTVGGHAKVVGQVLASDATYIAFSSDRNVVGFQLNGSSDGKMLDGLPGL